MTMHYLSVQHQLMMMVSITVSVHNPCDLEFDPCWYLVQSLLCSVFWLPTQVAATAEATKQAALSMVNDAVSGIDSLVSSSTADLSASSSSTKAAGLAMDRVVGSAIAKSHSLKESLAAGNPTASSQIDTALTKFVARANELRGQLNSKQVAAGKAVSEVGQHSHLVSKITLYFILFILMIFDCANQA